MSDDPSVLGNLPRSRPGRRSSKRDGAKAATAKAATAKAGGAKPKSKPKRAGSAKPRGQAGRAGSGRAQARSVAKEPPPRQRPASPGDSVTGAIRLAGQVAGAGFKVAGEILKRVPRP